MPSHVVAFTQPEGFSTCGVCHSFAPCGSLILSIDGKVVEKAIRCWECMKDSTVQGTAKTASKGVSSRTRKKARRCEEQTAKETGGRQTAASGSGVAKGDSRTEWWMFEDKFTDNLSFRITKAMVTKAMAQAAKSGRSAVIRIHMKDGFSVGVVPWSDLLPYLEGGNNG